MSGWLHNRKPLRRTPVRRRGAPLRRRAALCCGQRRTGPSPEVVEVVLRRANFCCEVCGRMVGPDRGGDWQVHHRLPRGMGGSRRASTNWVSNLLMLCPWCHEVVERGRLAAYERGWLVHRGADPAVVAVLIDDGSCWVLLTRGGGYRPVPQPGQGWAA